jgi:hypothetical protein
MQTWSIFIAWSNCRALDAGFINKKIWEQKPGWNLEPQMKIIKPLFQGLLTALLVAAAPLAYAGTIWNGPTTNFTHSAATGDLEDQLTAGVTITRGTVSGGLYNAVTETGATPGVSPADTKWAVGTLANTNLTYVACPLEAGNNPPSKVGTTYVVHLVNENIFLSLTLTAWGGALGEGDKSFSYTRTTPPVVAPTPTVSITNPAGGAVFAAPASVTIAATATVSSGTVTNVQFFTNSVSLGSVTSSPFNLTANNLAAGAYNLMAVATAAGVSGTSAVVSITVVNPPSVSITNPAGGAVFAAPANVNIAAHAASGSGTVTNVNFLTNGVSLGSATSSPFNLTANNLAAGAYALTAVATAAGVSATSAVVSVSVVTPVAINLSGLNISGGQVSFNYTANGGLSYVVQSSTNLLNPWTPLVTNVASGSSVAFSNSLNSNGAEFYRVGLLPNP